MQNKMGNMDLANFINHELNFQFSLSTGLEFSACCSLDGFTRFDLIRCGVLQCTEITIWNVRQLDGFEESF